MFKLILAGIITISLTSITPLMANAEETKAPEQADQKVMVEKDKKDQKCKCEECKCQDCKDGKKCEKCEKCEKNKEKCKKCKSKKN